MKPLILLAAIAAAALALRRINPAKPYKPDADDSEVVGMPTLLIRLPPELSNAQTVYWDEWFATEKRRN